MKRIIHFANDEKFIDKAYDEFQQFDSEAESHFTIFSNSSQLKHIKFNCTVVDENYFKQPNVDVILNAYDLIIIHFLDTRYFELLKNKKVKTKILWVGWGGDYYWLINTLLGFSIYKELTGKQLGVKDNFLLKILKRFKNRVKVQLLNRIDYFSPVLEEDFLLIKKNYRGFIPKYVPWNYGNLEDHYISDMPRLGDAILLGNSATATNNHFDLLRIVTKLNLQHKKIIIPLSYGDKGYKDQLKTFLNQQGYNGENVVLLEDFLSHQEYNDIVSECSIVFMGHIRQQAMGNVISLLYAGARMFFFKDSIVYRYLIKNGIIAHSYEELTKNVNLLELNLDEEIIDNNRQILIQLWGKNINKKNTEKIIRLLQEETTCR